MQIQIQFISADVEDKGKWKMAEIAYKDVVKGQVSSKKLMSFNFPVVYKTLVDAKKGEVYTITMEKSDKGFWDWTAAALSTSVDTGSGGIPEGPTSKGFTSPKSTYETPEERAKKQVYIVRQSSLSAAVETLKTDKKNPTPAEVIAVAKQYETFVFGLDQQPPKLEDLPTTEEFEDIPL
jgi:hypothetical protein